MQDQKKFYRELKRIIKKDGTRKRRKFFNKVLADNPNEAHEVEFEFGRSSSKWLNGLDDEKKNMWLARERHEESQSE